MCALPRCSPRGRSECASGDAISTLEGLRATTAPRGQNVPSKRVRERVGFRDPRVHRPEGFACEHLWGACSKWRRLESNQLLLVSSLPVPPLPEASAGAGGLLTPDYDSGCRPHGVFARSFPPCPVRRSVRRLSDSSTMTLPELKRSVNLFCTFLRFLGRKCRSGACRTRTGRLLRARQALSQMS